MNSLFASRSTLVALLFVAVVTSPIKAFEVPPRTPATESPEHAKAKLDILLAAGLYTRWPPEAFNRSPEGPALKVGVVGPPPQNWDTPAANRQIAQRHVVIRYYQTASDVEPCEILFITGSVTRDDRQALIDRFRDRPVLLVGEVPGFCLEGGSLNFDEENGKVKFALNPQSLARKKLVVDPRFMRLARPSTTAETRNDKKP